MFDIIRNTLLDCRAETISYITTEAVDKFVALLRSQQEIHTRQKCYSVN